LPNWKKLITSGSDASLNSLFSPSITGSLQGTSSWAISASWAPGGGLSGGTTGYIPLWTGTNTLSSSILFQSSSRIGINVVNPQRELHVSGGVLFESFNTSSAFNVRYYKNTEVYGTQYVENTGVGFEYHSGSNYVGIGAFDYTNITPQLVIYSGDGGNGYLFRGAEYDINYSVNFVSFSLVDKNYVDNIATSSYSRFALSASYAPGGGLSGGATNYIPLWTGTSTLSSSLLYQSSSRIGINVVNPQYTLDVSGSVNIRANDGTADNIFNASVVSSSYESYIYLSHLGSSMYTSRDGGAKYVGLYFVVSGSNLEGVIDGITADGFEGLKYVEDFSNNYSSRSLVDKNYVDSIATSSYSRFTISASYTTTALSASYATTSSYAVNTISASYARTASHAINTLPNNNVYLGNSALININTGTNNIGVGVSALQNNISCCILL